MAQTLASATTPLCGVDEFLKRVDRGAVAKLASDDPDGAPVADANLATDVNVLAAVKDASGLFESAVTMGKRYTAEDLATLKATDCAAQGMMFRIISDLAWSFLFERRPNTNIPAPASMARSLEWMELLAQGKRIFLFTEAQNATILEKIDSSRSDIEDRNGVVQQASPYFGIRADRAQGCNNW